MPNDQILTGKSDLPNDQLSAQEGDQERAKEIERLRSMTIEEKFEQLERLYLGGQKIKRTAEQIAVEEGEVAEVRERWVRLKRAYLGESQS